jgi:hypothetical protein
LFHRDGGVGGCREERSTRFGLHLNAVLMTLLAGKGPSTREVGTGTRCRRGRRDDGLLCCTGGRFWRALSLLEERGEEKGAKP